MKRPLIIVLSVVAVLAALFVMLGDSAPDPIRSAWQSAFGEQRSGPRADSGFAVFNTESRKIEDGFACVRFVEKAGTEFSDRRRHCIIGEHRTLRISIYEPVGMDTLTKKVKLTWLDNEKPNARARNAPRHADRADARQAVRALAALYVPSKETDLMKLFTDQRDGIVSEGPFIAVANFSKREGFVHSVVEIRDGNYEQLASSEERQGRPGYDKCQQILSSIPALAGQEISGEPVPERSELYVSYFMSSQQNERFICEIHATGYYRIRVSQKQGQPFKVLAHGNLGGN